MPAIGPTSEDLEELAAGSEERAAALLEKAAAARLVIEELQHEATNLDHRARALETALDDTHERVMAAEKSEDELQARVSDVIRKAEVDVQNLTKQQLEEVRCLPHPSPVVRTALGLLYILLNPEAAQTAGYSTPDAVPWKERLSPMLKRDDLIQRIMNFPSPKVVHPLIAYPEVYTMMQQHVVGESLGRQGSKIAPVAAAGGRKGSKRSGSKTLTAANRAAELIARGEGSTTASAFARPALARGATLEVGASFSRPALARGSTLEGATFLRSNSKITSTCMLGDEGRLTVEAVDFASVAVGALFRWLLSQMRLARVMADSGYKEAESKVRVAHERAEALHSEESAAAKEAAKYRSLAQEARAKVHKAMEDARVIALEAETAAEEARALRLQHAEALAREARQEEENEEAARLAQEAEEAEETQKQQEAAEAAQIPIPAIPPEAQEPQLETVINNGDVALSSVEVEVRERITFEHGSAKFSLSSVATRSVHGVLEIMQGNSDLKLCVEGHCYSDEAEDLATKRANAVLEHLVENGVPRHRLRASGFGSAFPEARGAGAGRVEFSVIQEMAVKGTVQFSPCSAELEEESWPILEKVSALLLARPCLQVRIEGHTDSAHNWGCSNQELSEKRATAVVAHLEAAGIAKARLAPVGCGEKLPQATNSSRPGRALNRRVEFHILQRETVKALQDLLSKGGFDKHALQQLERTATGASVMFSMPIRVAAADLLIRMQADWSVQRLLHVASTKEAPTSCAMASLPDDCLRRILRWYFLLGCSRLNA